MTINTKDMLNSILSSISRIEYVRPGSIPNIDLYMDQVTTFMEEQLASTKRHEEDKILTKTMINNYAKNNLLPPPVKKKYSKEHVLALIFIYYFKNILSIKDIPGYSNLINLEMLEPLNDVLTTPAADFGGVLDQLTAEDGNFYGIPFRSDLWVVFYNKDLFDAAGVDYPTNDMTIAEYDELARKVTSGTGAGKVYGSHFHTWRSAPSLFAVLDGQHTVVDGNYDFMKSTYEWVLAEQNDGICQDYGTLKATSTHYSGVFFNNQVAMMNMGSWFIPTQIEKVKSGESLATNWGIVKYPHPEGVPAGTTLGTITSVAVNAASEKQAAALDFVKFVGGEAGAEIIAKTGTFPAIKSDAVLDELAKMDGFPTDEASKEALSTTQVYLEMPMHDKAADIEGVLNEAHDGIMTGAMTIDEGIQKMNDEVSALLG